MHESAVDIVPSLTLGAGLTLVSWWKPVLLLLPFVVWAWFVSKVLDKHAERFHLPRKKWGLGHLVAGLIALLAAFLMPVQGAAGVWVGLGVMLVILGADIAAYMMVSSKDDRVPEDHRVQLFDFSALAEARAAKDRAKRAGKAELVIKGPGGALLDVPLTDHPDFPVRLAAESLIMHGFDSRASLAELGPIGKDNLFGVILTIDGVKQAGDTMPAADAVKVIDMWKAAGKLDVADRRKKQSEMLTIEKGTSKRKVHLSTSGTQAGPRLALLIDPEKAVRRKPEELGLLEPQMAELKTIVEGKGTVLIAAGGFQGRTTTMYSILKMHDAYTTNVQTIEYDLQDTLEGVRQNKWDPATEGPEFWTLTRSTLRRDPDVLALADVPDEATAKEICRADQERTRIYGVLKADSALAAIQTWVKLVADPAAAAAGLRGVVAQRLVRKVCTNCRVPYAPAPDMLKKLGLPADKIKQLFKKGGQVLVKNKPEVCPMCQGTGYYGQEAVFELYALTDADREAIAAQNWNGLKAELRKRQLPTIQQAALRKLVDGVTTLEEIQRVLEGGGQPAPAKPATTPATAAPASASAKAPSKPA